MRDSTRPSARERILDAAEREFGFHGFDSASMRRITKEAEVALSLVNHHFGNKAELLHAVMIRAFREQFESRVTRMEALLAENPSPAVEEVFEAAVSPLFEFLRNEDMSHRALLGLRGVFEHDAFWPSVSELGQIVGDRIERALHDALPHVPFDELTRRWDVARSVIYMGMMPSFQNVKTPQPVSKEREASLRQYAFLIVTAPVNP